jgi:hypothetical protein
MKNYNPIHHFLQSNRENISKQFETIFFLKATDSPKYRSILQHGVILTEVSDRYTVIKHLKEMCVTSSISHLFEGRVVVDVGVGFGASYYPIKFGNPKSIIAVDPYLENLQIANELGYDECCQTGWEDYKFPAASLVFCKGNMLPSYARFFKKLAEDKVTDIIIIQKFLPNTLPYTYNFDYDISGDSDNCRWTYNYPVVRSIPSITELIRLANASGFGLCFKRPLHTNGKNVLKKEKIEQIIEMVKYLIHFSKVE